MLTDANISNIEEAFAYVADSALATVSLIATKTGRCPIEYRRHIHIAQCHLDFAKSLGVNLGETRAAEVNGVFGGDVESWAKKEQGCIS